MQFDDKLGCFINFNVFSMVLEYKFRMYKIRDDDQRIKIRSLQQYYEKIFKKQKKRSFYDYYIKRFRMFSDSAFKNLNKILDKEYKLIKSLPIYLVKNQNNSDQIQVSQNQYVQYLLSNYQLKNQLLIQNITKQSSNISHQNYTFFQYIKQLLQNHQIHKNILKQLYNLLLPQKCSEYIFKTSHSDHSNQSIQHSKSIQKIFKKIRSKSNQSYNILPIQDFQMFSSFNQQLLFFHQVTQYKTNHFIQLQLNQNAINLFIFSHGFQASSYDMLIIKKTIKLFYPSSFFLLAKSNQSQTQGDIQKMGHRLSNQIHLYIKNNFKQYSNLVIHMIGHSMGGLILRASLKYLQQYKKCFRSFITFSTPHLGYLNGINTSVGTGLWLIKKWKSILSLQQMSMTDKKTIQQTFIYKLSQIGNLKSFKNIILFGSNEDLFIPWHSGRIQIYKQGSQKKNIKLQSKMINNILGSQNMQDQDQSRRIRRIHRIDVSFNIKQKNLNNIIGRTAHINFLTNSKILKFMLFTNPDLFS